MDKELFDAIKWAVTLVRKNFNMEDLSMQERGHIKVLNTALQNAESLPTSTNTGILKLPEYSEVIQSKGRRMPQVISNQRYYIEGFRDCYDIIARQLQNT